MKWLLLAPLLCLSAVCPSARGSEVLVQLTLATNASSLGLTLDLGLDAGSNTQALSGTITLAMDCQNPLGQVSLRDFRFRAVTNYQLTLVDGSFTAGVTNLQINHAAPGPTQPYVAVQPGGDVSFSPVPYRLSGFSGYSAGGVVCFILTSQGLPCRNVIRLADQPASQIEVFTGTLSSSNTVVQFDGTFMFGPTLLGGGATLSGGALIRATGTLLPCLDIQLDAARENYYVTWASAFHEFHLDRTESLSTPINWQRVNDSLVFTQGSSNVTRWLNEPGQAFYRLSNQ